MGLLDEYPHVSILDADDVIQKIIEKVQGMESLMRAWRTISMFMTLKNLSRLG